MNAKMTVPKIRVTAGVWERFLAYVQACPYEVGGLGTAVRRPDGLVITEFYLLEQKVTSVKTELDPRAVSRFVTEWVAAGNDLNAVRLWWHSHASMGVFWSADDEATIREMSENGWNLSIVGNHAGEYKARLTMRHGDVMMSADDLYIEVFTEISDAVLAQARTEVAEKVKQPLLRLGRLRSLLSPGGIPEAVGLDTMDQVVVFDGDKP